MTICVSFGSAFFAPKSLNMFWNDGMTNVSSTVITPIAITTTTLG